MKKNSFHVAYLLFLVLMLLIILGLYKCPIKYVFGISCPMCGLTRALYSVLKLNFKKSFYYYLFWPVILVILFFHILYEFKIININKKTIYFCLYLFAIINLIYYFLRLFSGSSIVYFNFSESLLYKIYQFILNVL